MYAPVHILPEMDDSGLPDEDVFFEAQRSPSEVHMSDEEIRIYRKAKHVMLYVSMHVSIMHESLTLSLYLLFLPLSITIISYTCLMIIFKVKSLCNLILQKSLSILIFIMTFSLQNLTIL